MFIKRVLSIWALLLSTLSSHSDAAGKRIAIDVGHSLKDPGAISARGVPEFSFNRRLARELKSNLSRSGISPILVGATGKLHNPMAHARVANKSRPALVLSIHHDSVQQRDLKPWRYMGQVRVHNDRHEGFSLFVSRKNVDRDASLKCASEIGASLRRGGFVPIAAYQSHPSGVPDSWADPKNGVYWFDDLIVLKHALAPAVLLEAGVIVNRHEEHALSRSATRTAMARSITQALQRCINTKASSRKFVTRKPIVLSAAALDSPR